MGAGGEVRGAGRNGRRRNCGWHVSYERRIYFQLKKNHALREEAIICVECSVWKMVLHEGNLVLYKQADSNANESKVTTLGKILGFVCLNSLIRTREPLLYLALYKMEYAF